MRTAMHVAMVCLLSVTSGCDAPDERAELAQLAAEEQDPEVRAELEALAAEEFADEDEVPGASDDLTTPSQQGGSCFFCPPAPPPDPNTPPKVINPYVQINQQNQAILFMAAAGSFITMPGATLMLQVPYSTQTSGPYALSFDQSGTQIRANVTAGWPPGTCRMMWVTNPNNVSSTPGSACR